MRSDVQKATRMYAIDASVQTVLRSRRPQACREDFMRENRETPLPPVAVRRAGGRTR